jgi:intracellular sulfur oxidation DsrE/DsrF family protein
MLKIVRMVLPLLLLCLSAATSMAQIAPAPVKPVINKVVLQINENDQKLMNLVLNNAENLIAYYKEKHQKVALEIVTFGPGVHMLREDTSPVKDRIATMSLKNPEIHFMACNNTITNMTKQEGKKPPIVSEAKLTPSGVVRLIELQRRGYAYIKP